MVHYFNAPGIYPEGCAAFNRISPNLVPDESMMKTDESMAMEQRFTLVRFIRNLDQTRALCEKNLKKRLMRITTFKAH